MAGKPNNPVSILASADLPDLVGARLLLVGAGPEDAAVGAKRGAAEVIERDRLDRLSEDERVEGSLQLAYLAPGAGVDAHPISNFAALWRLLAPDGTLVTGAPILTDPRLSRHARPLPTSGGASKGRWMPGRLAFRWMVETSGFDFRAWISDPDRPLAGAEPGAAYLLAARAERQPALDRAVPPVVREAP